VKRRKSPISRSALPRGPPNLLLRLAIAALPLENGLPARWALTITVIQVCQTALELVSVANSAAWKAVGNNDGARIIARNIARTLAD